MKRCMYACLFKDPKRVMHGPLCKKASQIRWEIPNHDTVLRTTVILFDHALKLFAEVLVQFLKI